MIEREKLEKKQPRKRIGFEQKVKEYMEKMTEIGRNITVRDEFYFSDGVHMGQWYSYWMKNLKTKLKTNYNQKDLKRIYLLAQIDNLSYDMKADSKVVLTLEERAEEYMETMRKLERKLQINDFFLFSDGTKMSAWYFNNIAKIKSLNKKNNLNKEDQKRIELFAQIDNFLYDMKKNNGTFELSFEEKVVEYKKKIKELQRNIKSTEEIYFSDGTHMRSWYCYHLQSCKNWIKTNRNVEEALYRLKQLAEIDDLLYSLGDHCIKEPKLSIEEKEKEYIHKIKQLGRNVQEKDQAYFSDETSMKNWYEIRISHATRFSKAKKLSPLQLEKIQTTANIDNILYDLGNHKVAVKKLSLKEKVDEYLQKIKELNRNLKSTETFLFSDNTSMAVWYFKMSSKIRKRKLQPFTYTKDEIKDLNYFAQIDDYLYSLSKQKIYKK